jgi:hypothetical protein
MNYWLGKLRGGESWDKVAGDIAYSMRDTTAQGNAAKLDPRYAGLNQKVRDLYTSIGRTIPDGEGVDYWTRELASGKPEDQVRNDFNKSSQDPTARANAKLFDPGYRPQNIVQTSTRETTLDGPGRTTSVPRTRQGGNERLADVTNGFSNGLNPNTQVGNGYDAATQMGRNPFGGSMTPRPRVVTPQYTRTNLNAMMPQTGGWNSGPQTFPPANQSPGYGEGVIGINPPAPPDGGTYDPNGIPGMTFTAQYVTDPATGQQRLAMARGGNVRGGLAQATSQPRYVNGGTGGQDDSVNARLSHGEYVMDADIVSALGDGNNEAGARKLDKMRENIRRHKRSAPSKSIPPRAKDPHSYLKGK